MNAKRKVAVAALVYIAIFIAVYALAAQMILPPIPSLGGGEGEVTAPADIESYAWILEGTPVKVTGACMTFFGDLPCGTRIYLALLDDADVVVASGSKVLTSDLRESEVLTITTSPSVDAATVYKITVTVVCP